MILEKEIVDAFGNVTLVKNQLYTRDSIKQYVRSYKVNRDGVELLYSCTNGMCNGRGYYEIRKPNGLREVNTCVCVDKAIEKIK